MLPTSVVSAPAPQNAEAAEPPRRTLYKIKAASLKSSIRGSGPGPAGFPVAGGVNELNVTVSGVLPGNTDQQCSGRWFHAAPSSKGEFHQLVCPEDKGVRVDLWQTEQSQSLVVMNLGVVVEGGAKAAWSTRTDDRNTWDCEASLSCTLQPGKEITIESDWRFLDCPGAGFEGCVYAN
ncbi:MAG: hypothetical protein LQ339_004909 [Xanthoria mediterranea]|nr:MAG: hypothetical protein LQ339_004909 [Xanthoria mediterranea]